MLSDGRSVNQTKDDADDAEVGVARRIVWLYRVLAAMCLLYASMKPPTFGSG
jgi:hypothetical protein